MSLFSDFFYTDDKTLDAPKELTDRVVQEYESSPYGYTQFNFLNDHRSLRPGKKHLLIGTTETGKTTLTRSVIFQLAKGAKILWYSTEESFDDMVYMMSKADIGQDERSKIHFRHEMEADKWINENESSLSNYLADAVTRTKSEIIVFDNLTTSKFYSGNIDVIVKMFDELSTVVKRLNVPIIIIAHTASGVKDMQSELFTGDDIKGPKIVSNRCEYVYAYQLITYMKDEGEHKQGIVRILKSRIGGASNSVYALTYNHKENSYLNDIKITFEQFKGFYEKRIKLK